MIVTIMLGFFTVFFSYLSKDENFKWGLKFSFILIFFFLALRFDFGNDYMYYYSNFQKINSFSSFNINNYNVKGVEIGWLLLNVCFNSMGFFAMNAVLAAFSTYVLYRFIKNWVKILNFSACKIMSTILVWPPDIFNYYSVFLPSFSFSFSFHLLSLIN